MNILFLFYVLQGQGPLLYGAPFKEFQCIKTNYAGPSFTISCHQNETGLEAFYTCWPQEPSPVPGVRPSHSISYAHEYSRDWEGLYRPLWDIVNDHPVNVQCVEFREGYIEVVKEAYLKDLEDWADERRVGGGSP